MTTPRRTSGAAIRDRRKAAGLTQRQLAEQFGYQITAISHWEAGRHNPASGVLLDLARVLKCQVEDLFEQPPVAIK